LQDVAVRFVFLQGRKVKFPRERASFCMRSFVTLRLQQHPCQLGKLAWLTFRRVGTWLLGRFMDVPVGFDATPLMDN
jgi:hypothetical protein